MSPEDRPQVRWLSPDENPWRARVLDVRPLTLSVLSTTTVPQYAENAVSFGGDDGTSFIRQVPPQPDAVDIDLEYRSAGLLADGVLYAPDEMEHKWALFYHGGRIFCVRSWQRQVLAIARVEQVDDRIRLTRLVGRLTGEPGARWNERVLDFLLRSHALGEVAPAPFPAELADDPQKAASWCFSTFGRHAQAAVAEDIALPRPSLPMRTNSLYRIAAARGHVELIDRELSKGVPPALLARNGMTALHWALAADDCNVLAHLLARGLPVDVQTDEGVTTLMLAAQRGSIEQMAFLLDRGADVNAVDERGFTALHRTAESGQAQKVALLLARGADPALQAQGRTARSLATAEDVLSLLR